MMLQDLSPSRVVAASARHAKAVLASTTHLHMAKAGAGPYAYPLMDGVALTLYGVTPQ